MFISHVYVWWNRQRGWNMTKPTNGPVLLDWSELSMQYTCTLNEDTGISLYHSGPVFYSHISCLVNQTPSKIRLHFLAFTFPGIILLEPVWLQTCLFQHGRQQQFGCKLSKAKLMIHYMDLWLLLEVSAVITGVKVPKKSLSVTLLTAEYVFNKHRNTESLYHNISRYNFSRLYSALLVDYENFYRSWARWGEND